LLENLRFHKEEEKGDIDFSQKLARLGDVYVNDAFGTAHRAHASTTVVAQFFPNDKMFGYLLAAEIESVDRVLKNAERPLTAVMGGAKVSSKISIITNLLDTVDHIIIGGGMTFTFVKAMGGKVGSSLVEDDFLDTAKQILESAKAKGVQIHLTHRFVIVPTVLTMAPTLKFAIATPFPMDGWAWTWGQKQKKPTTNC
jgi:phosphoglycerate kinase